MLRRLRSYLPMVFGYALVLGAVLLTLRQYVPVTVAGGSMRPALAPGDLVIVHRASTAEAGDIVLVIAPGHGPVIHRVAKVSPDGFLRLRGDANPIPDGSNTDPAHIVGRVVRVLPVGTWLEGWRADEDSATLSAQSNIARR